MKKNYELSIYDRLKKNSYFLEKKDLVAAAKVMATAFSDDASIRYLLDGDSMGPNDWKYFLCVLRAIHGKCVMLSSDEQINNLLIMLPPKLKSVPTIGFLAKGGIGLIKYFGLNMFKRSINYESNCKKVKSHFINSQTWYCMCFVVTKDLQGKGMGSRIMRPVLEESDRNHVPIYLETHKEVNVLIYERFGFKTVDINHIPGTDIMQYGMLRDNE